MKTVRNAMMFVLAIIWLVLIYALYLPYGLLRSIVCMEWYSELVDDISDLIITAKTSIFSKTAKRG